MISWIKLAQYYTSFFYLWRDSYPENFYADFHIWNLKSMFFSVYFCKHNFQLIFPSDNILKTFFNFYFKVCRRRISSFIFFSTFILCRWLLQSHFHIIFFTMFSFFLFVVFSFFLSFFFPSLNFPYAVPSLFILSFFSWLLWYTTFSFFFSSFPLLALFHTVFLSFIHSVCSFYLFLPFFSTSIFCSLFIYLFLFSFLFSVLLLCLLTCFHVYL